MTGAWIPLAWTLAFAVVHSFAGVVPARADGRLLATDGATQIEGSAGSGLVPWAVIAGTGTRDEIGGSGFATGVFVDDLRLASFGVAAGFYDRVELSFAHQVLEVRPLGEDLRQNVFGVKVRAPLGDVVTSYDHSKLLFPSRSQSIRFTRFFTVCALRSITRYLSLFRTAISPSSRYTTWRVCWRIAATSLAT